MDDGRAGDGRVSVEIRAASFDQWEVCRDVRLRALAEAPDAFCSTFESERHDGEGVWSARIARTRIALAWRGDEVVGTASLKPDPHEPGGREIVAMWVDPAHRRISVGSTLIHELIQWAADEGAPFVALWVAERNDHARALYERCGFGVTGERDLMPQGTDQVRMRRATGFPAAG